VFVLDLGSAIAYIAASAAALLGVVVIWRERRTPGGVALGLTLVAFAARELAGAIAVTELFRAQLEHWLRLRLLAQAFIASFSLWYSVSFARKNTRDYTKRWRLVMASVAFTLLALLAFGFADLFSGRSLIPLPSWLVAVDPIGLILHGVFLLAGVLVLMNVEATLRASSGTARWQVKFLVLGTGVLFGVETFLNSQVLLDSWIRTTLFPLGSAALLVSVGLIAVSVARRWRTPVSVFVNETQTLSSVALLAVGVYLLVMGGFVDVIRSFAGNELAPFVAFVLGLVAVAVVLLSGEAKERTKMFLNRHLQRPSYDYRKVWDEFTGHTHTAISIDALCAGITKTVAETFGCSVATLWLAKPGERRMVLGGSTAISPEHASDVLDACDGGTRFLDVMATRRGKVVDIRSANVTDEDRKVFRELQARYAVALTTGGDEPIGWLTLNDRIVEQPFGIEDVALFKTLGDQSAATVENRRLTEDLARAQEMEAFQTLSTFFVHDLKNLASRLSLAMQNLPAHFDKPAFRADLLATMTKSLSKIDSMTSRLTSISKGMDIERAECDFNGLISETLEGLNGTMATRVTKDLEELPRVGLDQEQIRKVLTNLLLNAQDASDPSGEITVRTSDENGWVLLSVADRGCGMTEEFIANHLFKPFQTTKKQGLGIGLFHTKKIVEAHGGRIEVNSRQGEGSTFRILLPNRQPVTSPRRIEK